METDGPARRWSMSDSELFDDAEAVCDACGGYLDVGQMVQERPAFSLKFFHVDTSDCQE